MIIRKTLREQVVEILRHKILSGEIKPGERIIEAKVAEELKVSRGPLREALRQIEEEGLVVKKNISDGTRSSNGSQLSCRMWRR